MSAKVSVLVDVSLCYSHWFVILVAFSRISLVVVVFFFSIREKKIQNVAIVKFYIAVVFFFRSAVEQQLISIQLVSTQLCGTVVFWTTVTVFSLSKSSSSINH